MLGNGQEIGSIVEQLKNDMTALTGCFEDWHWYNIFSKLKDLCAAIGNLVAHVLLSTADSMALDVYGNVAQEGTVGQVIVLLYGMAMNDADGFTYHGSWHDSTADTLETVIRARFLAYLTGGDSSRAEQILRRYHVKGGTGGLDFSASRVADGKLYLFVSLFDDSTEVLYVPVVSEGRSSTEAADFFKGIMFATRFDSSENCDYIAEIINFLNQAGAFSVQQFKELLERLRRRMPAGNPGADELSGKGYFAFLSAAALQQGECERLQRTEGSEKTKIHKREKRFEASRCADILCRAGTAEGGVRFDGGGKCQAGGGCGACGALR